MAPRKAAKAAKAVKVASKQPEDLPKNGDQDSDVEEAVADPVEVKKPRLAGKKVKAQDEELENYVEEKGTSKGGKKEIASENGNGVPKKEEEMAEEDDEEEEEKEKKPKRAARQVKGKVEEKKPATKRGRGKAVVEDVVEKEDEEEEAEEQPAPKRGRKAKAAPSKKLTKKGTKARKEDEEEKAEESDHSAEEKEKKQVEQPKKGRNAKAAKVTSKTEVEKKGEESDDSAEEKEEKHVEQPKKGRNAKAVKVTPKTEMEKKEEESDDSAEEKEEKQVEQPKKGRNAKAVKVASKEEEEENGEESDDSVEKKEEKQTVTKRGRKVKAASSKSSKPKEEDAEDEEESDQSSEPEKKVPAKRGTKRGAASKKDDGSSEKAGPSKKAKANPTVTDWDSVTVESVRENSLGKTSNFRITSWNVDGLRAWVNKGGLDIIQKVNPDILCLQETKCSVEKLPEEIQNVEGYKMYWCTSQKDGYAGVGILTKMMPIDVFYGIENDEQDVDGRCITAEFKKFYLINVYVPNAGRKLVTLPKRLEWNEAFKTYVKKLDEKKPVIICGDLNVAHNEIDLANPKTNKKNAGFTQEERDGMTDFLDAGFVDTFRQLYPDKEHAYTFWTYMMNARAKNTGWRLDYFLLSERSVKDMCDNVIHSQALGSDHCPITLFMNI